MKKILFLVAAAVAAGVSLAIPEPGLKQYAVSGFSSGKYLTPDNWTDFKPSDPVVMPGALMAQEASINGRTWEGTKYPFANGNGYWYEGYMKLEAGKTYSGFSRFDDGGCVYIDGQLVYNQGSNSGYSSGPSFTPQPFVCTKAGWYKLQLGVWDWSGGRALKEGTFAIVQWSDLDPADIRDNTRTYWNEFWDADADGKALGTYLYTEIPAQCDCELTRLSETSYKIAAVYTGVQSSVRAVAKDASGNRIETSAVTLDEGDQTVFTLSELAADTAYDLILEIDLNGTTLSQKIGGVFTGTVSIAAGIDADEATGHVGTFTVALSGGAVALSDIEVLYAVSDESTAVAGQTYVTLPGKVTIPSGANAVTIQVVPAVDKSIAENTTVRLDLVASTVCGVHSSAASATITIVDGEFAGWMYDATLGQISCDGWIFAATVVDGTSNMKVGSVVDYPASGKLDFGKSVRDDQGGVYAIVEFNGRFCDVSGNNLVATDASKAVTELVLPSEGLVKIGANAFAMLTNCTRVDPLIPDSVTSLGDSAFASLAAQQPVRIWNVATIANRCFGSSKITEANIGPALKNWNSGYGGSPVASCGQLTNINFDAGITGAKVWNGGQNGEHQFTGCSKLTGTLDFSGFTHIIGGRPFDGTPNIKKLIFGSGVTLSPATFSHHTKLEEVVFKGLPPTFNATGTLFGSMPATSIVVTYVPEEYTNEWAVYAKDGVVNSTTSCWSSDWVNENVQSMRPLVYKGQGGGGELGDWVVENGFISRDDWKFEAVKGPGTVVVGACVAAPDEVSTLDFTGTVTDGDGNPLTIVSLNTKFGSAADLRAKVGTLVLPTEGLTSIGEGAFSGCTALTNIVNFLPDCVTSVGSQAFASVHAQQPLYLNNVATLIQKAFASCWVNEVNVGPALKEWNSGYSSSPFQSCTKLTNINFSAGISGARMTGTECHFSGCSALTGTLDFSGFVSFAVGRPFEGVTKVERVILGSGLTLAYNTFAGITGLKEMVFMAEPPTFSGTKGPLVSGQISRVVPTYVYKAYKKEWAPYTAGGVVLHKGSTWAADYVAEGIDLKLRPLIGADFVDGLMLLVK